MSFDLGGFLNDAGEAAEELEGVATAVESELSGAEQGWLQDVREAAADVGGTLGDVQAGVEGAEEGVARRRAREAGVPEALLNLDAASLLAGALVAAAVWALLRNVGG